VRVLATPVVGELVQRVATPSPKTVVRLMTAMGEGATIGNHPNLIQALVAAGNDPVASATNLTELRAIISPFGFRRALRPQPEELRRLRVPTLLVWGDHDPVGAVGVAEAVAALIPAARLAVLPAGHVPWLGNPDRTAELLSAFVR
jgi:pimeloyl-ACP methyl ester carboxylesterase